MTQTEIRNVCFLRLRKLVGLSANMQCQRLICDDHLHSQYPILIKVAVHGVGGKGMCVVSNSSKFMGALELVG